MKAGTIIAVLAAFLAVAFVSQRANAEHAGSSSIARQIHGYGGCNSWARITSENATCLYSGWGHRGIPPYWQSFAENKCHMYGTVIAHVDVPNEGDTHIHAETNGRTYADSTNKPRSIKCCVNHSDLCWKDQVEPKTSGEWEGHIRVIQVHSGSYSSGYADVRTHEQRYELCSSEEWSHVPYCDVDPEGDAHVMPASMVDAGADRMTMAELRARPCGVEGEPSCDCGDHICDRFDCEIRWERSPARTATEGHRCHYTLSVGYTRYPARRCNIVASCNTTGTDYKWIEKTAWIWHTDDLVYCATNQGETYLRADDCDYDYDCGDHWCTATDCAAAHTDKPENCESWYYSYQNDEEACLVESRCVFESRGLFGKRFSTITLPMADQNNLNNCDGRLTDGSC